MERKRHNARVDGSKYELTRRMDQQNGREKGGREKKKNLARSATFETKEGWYVRKSRWTIYGQNVSANVLSSKLMRTYTIINENMSTQRCSRGEWPTELW